MLQGEHSATLSTFIKLPYVIKIFVLSIFEWPLKTHFTVLPPAHATWILMAMTANDGSDEHVHRHCLTKALTTHTDKRMEKCGNPNI